MTTVGFRYGDKQKENLQLLYCGFGYYDEILLSNSYNSAKDS